MLGNQDLNQKWRLRRAVKLSSKRSRTYHMIYCFLCSALSSPFLLCMLVSDNRQAIFRDCSAVEPDPTKVILRRAISAKPLHGYQ